MSSLSLQTPKGPKSRVLKNERGLRGQIQGELVVYQAERELKLRAQAKQQRKKKTEETVQSVIGVLSAAVNLVLNLRRIKEEEQAYEAQCVAEKEEYEAHMLKEELEAAEFYHRRDERELRANEEFREDRIKESDCFVSPEQESWDAYDQLKKDEKLNDLAKAQQWLAEYDKAKEQEWTKNIDKSLEDEASKPLLMSSASSDEDDMPQFGARGGCPPARPKYK